MSKNWHSRKKGSFFACSPAKRSLKGVYMYIGIGVRSGCRAVSRSVCCKSCGSNYFLIFWAMIMKLGTHIGLRMEMCKTYFFTVLDTALPWERHIIVIYRGKISWIELYTCILPHFFEQCSWNSAHILVSSWLCTRHFF